MTVVAEYRIARRSEDVARLRRVLALRTMAATGRTQRQIAEDLGISQPAVSQQMNAKRALDIDGGPAPAEVLLEAAAPLVKEVAASLGFSDVAVFGSVARGEARVGSDVDLLVTPPPGATIEDMTRLRDLMERIIGRSVDVVSYGALKAGIDDDILRRGGPAVMSLKVAKEYLKGHAWSDAVGNRNWLIHQYDQIDRVITWSTLTTSLPTWAKALDPTFEEAAALLAAEG